MCIPTRKEQAAALLDTVLRKDNRAYISFYNALIRESYGDLAGLLHNNLPLLSPEGEKSFADGMSNSGNNYSLALTCSDHVHHARCLNVGGFIYHLWSMYEYICIMCGNYNCKTTFPMISELFDWSIGPQVVCALEIKPVTLVYRAQSSYMN